MINKDFLENINHFFFDLDGTLSDSKLDILCSIEEAYKNLGFSYDPSKLKIGPLLPEIIREISKDLSEKEEKAVAIEFRRVYSLSRYKNTILFEGVEEFLQKLSSCGKSIYLATNKPQKSTNEVLEKLNIKNYFDYIGTPDFTGESLQKNEVIKEILEILSINPSEAVMIGDTIGDMNAGKACGLKALFFTKGYGEKAGAEFLIDACFEDYSELVGLV